ncbi:M56 family metallopeptidase [Formosa algae]|uniref:Peptidase M56 domain-containing protein n=1 Tax=Formosa algae TaxID=225843 RepID=A0A9X0YI39_9FLAO|nr:M56 family metallopeptidase [Formosa algae]MBP1838824.1 hypothetical protein [Formosa algae]MDQ0333601.1 hypothetical protein [Formosa algae]OEI80264.1 hypothetical protein AST99_10135 [Formosa algae]
MDYFLKASAVITIFYVVYMFWLQKETFFNSNRWFLLAGLMVSAILPLIIIPIYIDRAPITYQFTTTSTVNVSTAQTSFSWLELGTILYSLGVLFFLIKFIIELFSLKIFISKLNINKQHGYSMAVTTNEISPFSFFKYIVYNPNHFTETELTHIINHEKIHASQFHSIDILVSKLATVFFWCNPIIWLYKKALIQNLEFLADQSAMQHAPTSKVYQKLLLKTTVPIQQLALTTNFYNSLIKKRILMLNTSKSKTIHTFKYAVIIPALVLFMMSFNTKTVYNTIQSESSLQATNESELVTIISKDNTDEYLESLVESFKSKDVILKIKNVKRNAANEIISITIDAKSKNSEITYKKDSDSPISAIKITLNIDEKTLGISAEKTNSDIVFTASKNASKVDTNNKDAFIVQTSDGSSITLKKLNEDLSDSNVMYISEDGKRTHVTTRSTRTVVEETQETYETNSPDEQDKNTTVVQENSTATVTSNNAKSILYFLDDKKITPEEMKAIDPETIAEVNVLKDQLTIDKYGDDAKDGVIKIILKKDSDNIETSTQSKNTETNKPTNFLIFIDGVDKTGTPLNDINPDTIESMNVLRGNAATEKYGDKAKEGVIELTLKKD